MTLYERLRFRLRMLLFALTVKPAAGGEDPPANPPVPTPEPTPEPPNPEPTPEPDKSFSQADVDRIVQARLKQAEPRYAELRDKAEKFDTLQSEQQSDLEKAQTEAEQAKQERDDAVSRARQQALKAAVVAEAAKQGAVDADAVVALLPQDAVMIGDDGEVTGAEEAVKALLEQKQFLAGNTPQPGPGDGGARTPAQPKDLDAQIAEAEAKGDVNTSLELKSQKLAQSMGGS